MPHYAPPPSLILASSSSYRVDLLRRLALPFTALAADIDETALADEACVDLVQRLSIAKARWIQQQHPQAWVIGADQAAHVDGQILGKPGTRQRAIEQLSAASGRSVQFVTGVALLTPQRNDYAADLTTVQFRALSRAAVSHYVDSEAVLDCAGSFKCEGLGISLFDAIETRDPTALIGLPLISVCRLLRGAGYPLL